MTGRPSLPVCLALVLFGANSVPASLPAQEAPNPAYDTAAVAWEEGRYPDALARLERLLASPDGEALRRRAALLTGELYVTTEIAPDGRLPRWSPGGRYLAYESGARAVTRTVVLRWDGARLTSAHELRGGALAFAPGDGFAAYLTAEGAVREVALSGGEQREIPAPGLRVRELAYGPDGTLFAGAATASDPAFALYALGPAQPLRLTAGPGSSAIVAATSGGLVYSVGGERVAIRRSSEETWSAAGSSPSVSADGRVLVWLSREGEQSTVMVMPVDGSSPPRAVVRTAQRLAAAALSPDGRRVVYQRMPREDWELFVVDADGSNERRLTHEIQHDVLPRFLTGGVVLAAMGEPRHRRSYLYNLGGFERTRLFHNNTLRTVAPEYQWVASPDGAAVVIVADRDGNTISPERGAYLVDLRREVTAQEVLDRVRTMARAERDLRARGERMFAPVAARVRAAVADVSVTRIYGYARDLFEFDSKYITRPGNRMAIDYLERRLREFGYDPELQWFEPRGVRTANLIATLRGTTNPGLVYVVSSHFDSVQDGPGSDDNTSGTTALLEAARVLRSRPQAATIQFAFFTGEEAGLLGSREFVRRAVRDSVRLVGALNNDMIGWRNDPRLDNTIRYSNDGLRDLQHAAAFLFTDLITYDSRYYQSTDAAAYFEAYGDIVGGIGSYPILGNPHYHQSHDVLETIDQRLVAEVSKTTVASLILMATAPSRLAGLEAVAGPTGVTVAWRPAPEQGVSRYLIRYGPAEEPMRRTLTVSAPRAELPEARTGWQVAVKAVLSNGIEAWDWAIARAR